MSLVVFLYVLCFRHVVAVTCGWFRPRAKPACGSEEDRKVETLFSMWGNKLKKRNTKECANFLRKDFVVQLLGGAQSLPASGRQRVAQPASSWPHKDGGVRLWGNFRFLKKKSGAIIYSAHLSLAATCGTNNMESERPTKVWQSLSRHLICDNPNNKTRLISDDVMTQLQGDLTAVSQDHMLKVTR